MQRTADKSECSEFRGPSMTSLAMSHVRCRLNVHSEGRAPLLHASLSTVWLDLGLPKTPVPRFICVAKGILFRVGQCETELFRVQRKPSERYGVRKRPIQS